MGQYSNALNSELGATDIEFGQGLSINQYRKCLHRHVASTVPSGLVYNCIAIITMEY